MKRPRNSGSALSIRRATDSSPGRRTQSRTPNIQATSAANPNPESIQIALAQRGNSTHQSNGIVKASHPSKTGAAITNPVSKAV